jgi:Essential protein Yae1, N terminal
LKNGIPSVSPWLTDRYYKQGYDEGFEDGLKSGPGEGFDFGHEVSFQKFLPLGILLGRCVIWKSTLTSSSPSVALSAAKKTRALKQVQLLEDMILALDRNNESEEQHGKFEEVKRRIINKSRVVESLMGEERRVSKEEPVDPEEDHIALAKRMDMALQL